jgi:Flp pilus assembly protein TadG
MMKLQSRTRRRQKGAAFVEFALILLVLTPLMLGTAGIGLNMLRSLATIQIGRDAGHMFARGADFSQPGNQTILADLGADIGLTTNAATSNAVVVLSTVIYIDKAMCAADGKVDASGNPLGCTNYTKWAFRKRLTIGNTSMRTSNFGSPLQSGPNPVVVDSTGSISVHDQVTNAGDVATFTVINPYSVVNGAVSGLPSGQVIYIAEAAANGIRLPPFAPNSVMYSYNMF